MSIYIDELFIINFIACLAMIKAFAIIKGTTAGKFRCISAAAYGAAVSAARFAFLKLTILFAAAEILIPVIAFKHTGFKRIVLFILIKYALSGFCILCVSFFGGSSAVIRGGIIYFDIEEHIFIPIFIAAYILLYITSALIKKHRTRTQYTLRLCRGLDTVTVKAFYDSGNLLKNPYDGTPVMIADEKSVEKLLPKNFILIPFNSVGRKSGMLKAFRADSVFCVENGKTVNNATIGISADILSKCKTGTALVGPDFFEEDL